MLLLGVLIALAVAFIRGGRIQNIESAPFRAPLLPIVSLLIEFAAKRVNVAWLSVFAVCVSYALIFLFVFLNRTYKKTALALGAGSLCNFLVIALNDFRMPVGEVAARYLSEGALARLTAGEMPMYALQTADTRLPFLGDIICLPLFGMASVGDVFLVIGAALWIFAALKPRLPKRWVSG